MFLSQICCLSRPTQLLKSSVISWPGVAIVNPSLSLLGSWWPAHQQLLAVSSPHFASGVWDLSQTMPNCRISVHSKPACAIHLSSISPWEGGEGCCWVQLSLLNACKVGTEIYQPDWCMRSSCLEHHEVLGRRCFFCLGKGSVIYLSGSKQDALRTTSKCKHYGQRERGKKRRGIFPLLPGHWMGQVTRIVRSNNVKKGKLHPFKCSSVENMNWFCSLSPLLHYHCGVWKSPTAHRGDFPPFTPAGGSRAPRILLPVLTQVTILALFVIQLFFVVTKQRLLLLFGAGL